MLPTDCFWAAPSHPLLQTRSLGLKQLGHRARSGVLDFKACLTTLPCLCPRYSTSSLPCKPRCSQWEVGEFVQLVTQAWLSWWWIGYLQGFFAGNRVAWIVLSSHNDVRDDANNAILNYLGRGLDTPLQRHSQYILWKLPQSHVCSPVEDTHLETTFLLRNSLIYWIYTI